MSYQFLIFDPIDFRGGSKVAVETIFNEYPEADKQTLVLSNDPLSWNSDCFKRQGFWFPEALVQSVHGIPFLMKHVIYAMSIIWFIITNPSVKVVIATSGPGIDLGLYFAKWLLKPVKSLRLIQMIQGPVAESGMSAKCLAQADQIYYLENTAPDLQRLSDKLGHEEKIQKSSRYQLLKNGLASALWPSLSAHKENKIFWAASNLKWKGMDLLVDMLREVNNTKVNVKAEICFIRADNQGMPVSEVNQPIPGVNWHEMPDNLDEIRQSSNMFISTSTREPFGLSILEAMAAGLCVLIPSDGAYWDQRLEHGKNCIKYSPNDVQSLTEAVQTLLDNPETIRSIGLGAKDKADDYRAIKRYSNVHQQLRLEANHAV